MIENRRAQIGKIVTSPVVIIVVAFIMAVFVFVSISYASFRAPVYQKEAILSIPENTLLLKDVNLKINGIDKKMMIFDAVLLRLNDEISLEQLNGALVESGKNTKKCYFLNYGKDGLVESMILRNEPSIAKQRENNLFIQERILKSNFLADGKQVSIESYLGVCP